MPSVAEYGDSNENVDLSPMDNVECLLEQMK